MIISYLSQHRDTSEDTGWPNGAKGKCDSVRVTGKPKESTRSKW